MRRLIFVLLFSTPVFAYEECGVQPAAPMGCFVGGCVDGKWKVLCPDAEDKKCANSPPPAVFQGCFIGKCEQGVWQVNCEKEGFEACQILQLTSLAAYGLVVTRGNGSSTAITCKAMNAEQSLILSLGVL